MNLFDLVNVVIEVAILLFYCSTLFDFKRPMTMSKVLIVLSIIGIVTGCGMLRLLTHINLIISCVICFTIAPVYINNFVKRCR